MNITAKVTNDGDIPILSIHTSDGREFVIRHIDKSYAESLASAISGVKVPIKKEEAANG